MKRPAFVILFMFSIVIGLAIAQVSISNQISTTGAELVALQNELAEVKRNNMVLQEQVLQASALTNIEKKAATQGFVAVTSPRYVSTPLPLAMKQ